MNDAEKKEARALCERATPGPWEWEACDPCRGFSWPIRSEAFPFVGWANLMGDADFIARARDLLPKAMAKIERLEAGIAQILAKAAEPNYGCDADTVASVECLVEELLRK